MLSARVWIFFLSAWLLELISGWCRLSVKKKPGEMAMKTGSRSIKDDVCEDHQNDCSEKNSTDTTYNDNHDCG